MKSVQPSHWLHETSGIMNKSPSSQLNRTCYFHPHPALWETHFKFTLPALIYFCQSGIPEGCNWGLSTETGSWALTPHGRPPPRSCVSSNPLTEPPTSLFPFPLFLSLSVFLSLNQGEMWRQRLSKVTVKNSAKWNGSWALTCNHDINYTKSQAFSLSLVFSLCLSHSLSFSLSVFHALSR